MVDTTLPLMSIPKQSFLVFLGAPGSVLQKFMCYGQLLPKCLVMARVVSKFQENYFPGTISVQFANWPPLSIRNTSRSETRRCRLLL